MAFANDPYAFFEVKGFEHVTQLLFLKAELLVPFDSHDFPKRECRFATANTIAAEVSLEAESLEAAVTAARQTGAKLKVLSRVRTALGKVVHGELANLKRLYKAEGFSEAEIHAVIPDRPGKTKKVELKQGEANQGAPP